MKILVTYNLPRLPFENLPSDWEITFPLNEQMSREEILRLLPEYDVLLSIFHSHDLVDKEIIDAGSKLKLISNYGVGYNNIDVQYAREKGIAVTNTPHSVNNPTGRPSASSGILLPFQMEVQPAPPLLLSPAPLPVAQAPRCFHRLEVSLPFACPKLAIRSLTLELSADPLLLAQKLSQAAGSGRLAGGFPAPCSSSASRSLSGTQFFSFAALPCPALARTPSSRFPTPMPLSSLSFSQHFLYFSPFAVPPLNFSLDAVSFPEGLCGPF